ncbi:MAG: ComEC/Rec2 family competence protein [Minisyncoccia bacterium]
MNSSYFYAYIFGFVGGIFLSSFYNLGFSFFLLLLFLSLVIFYLWRRGFFEPSLWVGVSIIFVVFFSFGVLRFDVDNIRTNPLRENLDQWLDTKIIITGVVSDEPTIKTLNQRAVVDIEKILVNNNEYLVKNRILIQTKLSPLINYGDEIEAQGTISKPDQILGEDGRIFDYASYLENQEIFYLLSFSDTKILSNDKGNFIMASLYKIKNYFMMSLNYLISEPEVSYLNGILLGSKSSLPIEWNDIFAKVGLTHIVALSGYNITIVSEWLQKVLILFLPFGLSLCFGALGIIAFVIMTGASATAVRAGIMALIVIFGRMIGRQYNLTRALLIAGFVMILFNPRLLVFDLSFQLSFLATLSLIIFPTHLEKYFTWITKKFNIRDLFLTTLSAQILVLPLLLYKIGWLSFVSLPANLLVLPLIPPTMFLGFFTGLFGLASTYIAWPFALLTQIFLSSQMIIMKTMANLPGSAIKLSEFSFWWIIPIYILIIIWVWRMKKFEK